MRIETRQGITEAETKYLMHWRERVFPEEGRGKEWSSVAWHTIAYSQEGHPVAHLGFDGFRILVDSMEQRVVGIGGVVVRPEFQGQRIPEQLFNEVHDRGVYKVGAKVCTLFCPSRLVRYYEKHGYTRHQGSVHFMQQGNRVLSNFEFMHRGDLRPDATVELQGAPW